jgi:hypothetical protein
MSFCSVSRKAITGRSVVSAYECSRLQGKNVVVILGGVMRPLIPRSMRMVTVESWSIPLRVSIRTTAPFATTAACASARSAV